jgi:ferredoxin
MPQIEVEGRGTFEVAAGTRLVRAIEDNGVHILHRCGGFARCTTCRIRLTAGEPQRMTRAEHDKLADKELLGEVRLSCQIICDRDMRLRVLMTLSESDAPDPGPTPEATITPPPEWIEAAA